MRLPLCAMLVVDLPGVHPLIPDEKSKQCKLRKKP